MRDKNDTYSSEEAMRKSLVGVFVILNTVDKNRTIEGEQISSVETIVCIVSVLN
jgi:hypothetical protein